MRWCLLILLFASVSCVHRTDPFSHSVTTAEKPWTHEAFKNDPEEFQFAILTDRTGAMREGVFASAVTKMNAVQPEFVVSVGDYIQGYKTDRAVLHAEWEEMDRIAAGFEMPFFFLPGNHDITNPTMKTMYEERLGRRYYAFVYRNVLFVCLDTQDQPVKQGSHVIQDAGLLPEQVAWARGVMREHADVRWTFVLMHQPLWLYEKSTAAADSRHPATGRVTGWGEIRSALGDRDYTVFAGHLHRYTKYVRQERDHFVLATTGGGSQLRGPAYGEFDHAVWITMTRNGPKVANLLLDGIVGDDVYTERTAAFRASVKLDYAVDLPRRTITGSLRIHNPFSHPLTVAGTWTGADMPGWQIHSTIGRDPIQPGEEKTYAVELQYEPGTDLARFPELSLECAAGSELNGVFPQETPQRALLAASPPRQVVRRPDHAPTVDGTLNDDE